MGTAVMLTLRNVLTMQKKSIQGEHECAAGAAEHVGEGALEESARALVLRDLHPAVQRILVLDRTLLAARLHHHAPSHRVERVRGDAGAL